MPDRSLVTRLAACSLTALALAVAVAGCGASVRPGRASRPGPVSTGPAVRPLAWSPCPSDASLQCGTVTVPVDYLRPDGPTLSVAVTQAPATGPVRRGTLVFNPGGPGESGNQILPVVLDRLPPPVRQSFDVVSFDPRGTGASQPLDCGTSPEAAASAVPVPPEPNRPLPGAAVFAAMARACASRERELVPFVDTVDTARDLDRIRRALGLSRIDYYGLSYGTVLGAVYAGLFPGRVGAFVLDGAVDVGADLATQADQEAPVLEQSLDRLLASCSATPGCPLGDDATASYRSLSATLTRRPLPAPSGSTYPVTVGDLDTASLLTLSVPGFTPDLYEALAAAGRGDGAPLRALAVELETDLDGASLVDPLWAITCNDTDRHPGPVPAGDQARALAARYPLIGAYAVTYSLGGCVAWPSGRRPVSDIRPTGIPPVLVIGNTLDPNTPIVGARHLAARLPGARLLTWRGTGHTWLLNGAADPCMQHLVTTYLLGGGLPPPRTVCG